MKRYLTKRYIILMLIVIVALGLEAYEWHAIRLASLPIQVDKEMKKNIEELTYQNSKFMSDNAKLKTLNLDNEKSIKALQDDIASLKTRLDRSAESEIELLIDKLKDKNYTRTYNEGYTWYTAAEALGLMGKPAIPHLIKKIDTQDEYERSLVFYALLLASQAENVKEFAGTDYIKITDSFDSKSHEDMKKEALRWWEKYKDKF